VKAAPLPSLDTASAQPQPSATTHTIDMPTSARPPQPSARKAEEQMVDHLAGGYQVVIGLEDEALPAGLKLPATSPAAKGGEKRGLDDSFKSTGTVDDSFKSTGTVESDSTSGSFKSFGGSFKATGGAALGPVLSAPASPAPLYEKPSSQSINQAGRQGSLVVPLAPGSSSRQTLDSSPQVSGSTGRILSTRRISRDLSRELLSGAPGFGQTPPGERPSKREQRTRAVDKEAAEVRI